MSQLVPFDFGGRSVRVVLVDGQPWFVARDVCAVLGIVNGSDAVARLDPDGVGTTDLTDSLGRVQTARTVSESGLYELIFQSRRPEAKAFKRWVTTEVLPTIRKTGSYGQVRELTRLELIELARQAETERLEAERRIAALEPVAHSWEQLADARGDYSLREAAQILDRDPAISTGQNRLARYLREAGWLDRSGTPYQRQVDLGRLALRTVTYQHPRTDEQTLATQVRVTVKGVHELHKLLGGARPLMLPIPNAG